MVGAWVRCWVRTAGAGAGEGSAVIAAELSAIAFWREYLQPTQQLRFFGSVFLIAQNAAALQCCELLNTGKNVAVTACVGRCIVRHELRCGWRKVVVIAVVIAWCEGWF